MPRNCRFVPGPTPAESVAEYQLSSAAYRHVLHNRLELETLGSIAARITASEPQIAPNKLRPFFELDSNALIITTSLKRYCRARKDEQSCPLGNFNVPLLR